MSSDPEIEIPEYPKPPERDVQCLLPVLAMVLSSADRDSHGRRHMAKDELVQRLREYRHAIAAVEWAIFVAFRGRYLEPCVIQQKVSRQLSRNSVEARATVFDVPGIAATDNLWTAWRGGLLGDGLFEDWTQGSDGSPVERNPEVATGISKEVLVKESRQTSSRSSIVLVLSGGGLRATLFHLGMLLYLHVTGRLPDVNGIVSVSGGSILAAHFVKHWKRVIASRADFMVVSGELLEFVRSDLRNRVAVSWLWSRLIPWKWRRRYGRTGYLESAYRQQFGETLLGAFIAPVYPRVAIVATDSIRQERVAFMADRIMKFPINPSAFDSGKNPEVTVACGVRVSVAVAASSCYPPVFPRMQLDHSALGLNYSEFKGELSVNDGGVAGNLGLEVLLDLHSIGGIAGDIMLVSDADRPQGTRPKNSIFADLETSAVALSEAGRDRTERTLGSRCVMVRLSERVPDPPGIPFLTQTQVARFRTDLDAPSWQEIHALLRQGISTAAYRLDPKGCVESVDEAYTIVKEIIHKAGGPSEIVPPSEQDLKHSHRRPVGKLLMHLIAVFAVATMAAWLGLFLWRWAFPVLMAIRRQLDLFG